MLLIDENKLAISTRSPAAKNRVPMVKTGAPVELANANFLHLSENDNAIGVPAVASAKTRLSRGTTIEGDPTSIIGTLPHRVPEQRHLYVVDGVGANRPVGLVGLRAAAAKARVHGNECPMSDTGRAR